MNRLSLTALVWLSCASACLAQNWSQFDFAKHPFRVALPEAQGKIEIASLRSVKDDVKWECITVAQPDNCVCRAAATRELQWTNGSMRDFVRRFMEHEQKHYESFFKDDPLRSHVTIVTEVLRETPVLWNGYPGYQFTLRMSTPGQDLFFGQDFGELDYRFLRVGDCTIFLSRHQFKPPLSEFPALQHSGTHPDAQAIFNSLELTTADQAKPTVIVEDRLDGTWIITASQGPQGEANRDRFSEFNVGPGAEWTFDGETFLANGLFLPFGERQGESYLAGFRTSTVGDLRSLVISSEDGPLLYGYFNFEADGRLTLTHRADGFPNTGDDAKATVTTLMRPGAPEAKVKNPFEIPALSMEVSHVR